MACPAPLALGSIAVGHDGELIFGQHTWIHAHLNDNTYGALVLRLRGLDGGAFRLDHSYLLRVEEGHNCLRFDLEVRVPTGHYRLMIQDERELAVGFLSVA